MGYELEVQGRDVEHIINRFPWLYAKDEDSAKGMCEINTHPFNWNWWVQNNGIKYIDEVRSNSKCHVDRKCGIHVHLSRAWFSRQHLIRMAKLFYANPEFIEHVSQRVKTRSANHWTALKKAANPWLLDEMKRCSTGDDLARIEGKDFNDRYLCGDVVDNLYEERHVALNFCPKNTIEIRIFQSTLNPKLIQAYLEFALACAVYTKDARFEDVNIYAYKGLREYVRLHASRFPNLHSSNLMYSCCHSWKS